MLEELLELSEKALESPLSQKDVNKIFKTPEKYLIELVLSANRIKRAFSGNRISTCSIISAKTGICSEDCAFCAQSKISKTNINRHRLLETEKILDAAIEAEKNGADRFSIVTSGWGYRGDEKEFLKILEAIQVLKQCTNMKIDVSLGMLGKKAIEMLSKVEVDRVHHNIETSKRFFTKVCTTHTFQDRVKTVKRLKEAGLEVCSGFIIGMGEKIEDRISAAETLRSLQVDSVPINMLIPIKGTPLGTKSPMKAMDALKSIAALRFLLPKTELRLCGGRVQVLGDLWILALFIVDGVLIGRTALTTTIRDPELDIKAMKDLGLILKNSEDYQNHRTHT